MNQESAGNKGYTGAEEDRARLRQARYFMQRRAIGTLSISNLALFVKEFADLLRQDQHTQDAVRMRAGELFDLLLSNQLRDLHRKELNDAYGGNLLD